MLKPGQRRILNLGAVALAIVSLPVVWGSSPFAHKLSKDHQIVHALSRLTFGPRPGDVEAVKKMGLKKWIERQLHPAQIMENRILTEKLMPLDSLDMDEHELMTNYPPPQALQQLAAAESPESSNMLPEDPERRASILRLVDQMRAGRARKPASAPEEGDRATNERRIAEILTPGQIRTLRRGSPEDRFAMLNSMPADKLKDLVETLPPAQRRNLLLFAPTEVRRNILASVAPIQVLAHDLTEGKLYRAIYSDRQLQEVLADFWYNHFNVFLDKGLDRQLVSTYERDAIRPHVLGKFRDLLQATAESPAMLFYLDNWQSVAPNANARAPRRGRGLNENYARELLELHTLGVDGGYTQKDVTEVARCFTGWTLKDVRTGAGFNFNERVHDKGEKVVLGVTIPAGGGMEDGRKVLDIVAHHASTARFVSRKLAQRFVADEPPPALVDRMAKTFRDRDGDIREVLRTMLASKEFWSEGAFRVKMKSPLEMVVSAVRALDARVEYAFGLGQTIANLGEPLYRKQEPTGYSNSGEGWMNSAALVARMNFALALAQNKLPGVTVDLTRFPRGEPLGIAQALLQLTPGPRTLEAIQPDASPAMVAGLLVGSPEFQRR